jgi:hypothetical protein
MKVSVILVLYNLATTWLQHAPAPASQSHRFPNNTGNCALREGRLPPCGPGTTSASQFSFPSQNGGDVLPTLPPLREGMGDSGPFC